MRRIEMETHLVPGSDCWVMTKVSGGRRRVFFFSFSLASRSPPPYSRTHRMDWRRMARLFHRWQPKRKRRHTLSAKPSFSPHIRFLRFAAFLRFISNSCCRLNNSHFLVTQRRHFQMAKTGVDDYENTRFFYERNKNWGRK